jgi:uncharacterized membrane protein YeaQ/YmgE (transglycosylase-associated protein family)
MKKKNVEKNRITWVQVMALLIAALTSDRAVAAGDVNAALNKVASSLKPIFDTAATVMYLVAAVAGLIGAVMLYQKWNSGDPNTGKLVGAWFGAAIFLTLAATFLKAVFL